MSALLIDVLGLPQDVNVGPADFAVALGRNGTWSTGPFPAVSVRRDEGAGGADRVTLTWPDNAVRNTWLRVTMLATDRTALTVPDVFYFGHLDGESGFGPRPMTVDATDLLHVRRNLFAQDPNARARFDFNGDGAVNMADLVIVRSNQRRSLPPLSPPAAAVAFVAAAGAVAFSDAPLAGSRERSVL